MPLSIEAMFKLYYCILGMHLPISLKQPARACVDVLDSPYIAAYFVRLHALHSLLLTTLLSSIAHNVCPHLLINGTGTIWYLH